MDNSYSDLYEKAKKRMTKLGFDDYEQDFIFSSWVNWFEHLNWLLTAKRKEISDWLELEIK